MKEHNIETLTSEVYDKLANNTNYDMFDCNAEDLDRFEMDGGKGKIYIEYPDKKFEVTIREVGSEV